MKVIEKNEGKKVPYVLSNNRLTIRDELSFDLSKYERDYKVNLDICENKDGILIIGLSDYYVAQLEIPPIEYKEEVIGEGEEQEIIRFPLPFDVGRVTLILWSLRGGAN